MEIYGTTKVVKPHVMHKIGLNTSRDANGGGRNVEREGHRRGQE